jgi:UDPglucose--hexose-1-phosphate uridylyltransferase
MPSPHRRYNPLLDEWVLCSPGRLERPWLGDRESVPRTGISSYDPDCYICPRNLRASGERNPDYRGVFLFDNDFPALAGDGERDPADADHPLFRSVPERGRCRVLSFSERHDRHLGEMATDEVRLVVDAWASESERLATEERAVWVQIFENRGPTMGASNPHPHGQIWSVGHVPTLPARKAARFEAYHEGRGGDLLGDYLAEEIRREERIVETNDSWVQVVPFWAVWPFETMLVPRRHVSSLGELSDEERDTLAALVGKLVRRYDRVFECAFPYSMGWYERPRDGAAHAGFRLHAVFLPPLLRSSSVRKFLVGYELTAEPQRDFTPEEAAERLRGIVP